MPRQIDEAQVLEAALARFVADGYAGATTKEIAAEAGVNEATLFRRFGGKAELVLAALRAALQAVPLRGLRPSEDLEADLLRVLEAYQQTYAQVGAVFPLLMVEAARHPELRPALDEAWTNLSAVFAIFAHHQARGALREEPPLVAANALLGPLLAMGLFAQALPGRPLPPIDPAALVRGFLEGRRIEGSARQERSAL